MGLIDWLSGRSEIPRRVFVIAGREHATPKRYGYWCVKSALDTAVVLVKALTARGLSREDNVFARIEQGPRPLQLLLVAVLVAAYYVYAASVLRVPRDVLDDVMTGITDGINSLTDGTNGKIDRGLASAVLDQVQTYIRTLHQELVEMPLEDPNVVNLDLGPTANAATQMLSTVYGTREGARMVPIELSTTDELMLQMGIKDAALGLMHDLKTKLQVTFAP